MEGVPLNANRHLRFQKCLPTEYSQSAGKVANGERDVNVRIHALRGRKRFLGSFPMVGTRRGHRVLFFQCSEKAVVFVRFFIGKTGHFPGRFWSRILMKTTDFIGDLVNRFAKGYIFTASGFRGEVKSLDAARNALSRMAGCSRLNWI